MFLIPISNPAELPDNNINLPICGVVPEIEQDNEEAQTLDDERFNQSIESIVVNLNQIEKPIQKDGEATVFLFTSATPSNRKSFISFYLSKRLTRIGKKFS